MTEREGDDVAGYRSSSTGSATNFDRMHRALKVIQGAAASGLSTDNPERPETPTPPRPKPEPEPPRPTPEPEPPRPKPEPKPSRINVNLAKPTPVEITLRSKGVISSYSFNWDPLKWRNDLRNGKSQEVTRVISIRDSRLSLVLWWETFGTQTWVTGLIQNSLEGSGYQSFQRVRIKVNGQRVADFKGDNACLFPMQAFPFSTRPASADGFSNTLETREFPAWSEDAMAFDTLWRSPNVFMNRQFFWHNEGPDGTRIPQDPDAVAGHGVMLYGAGKDDAFCGPKGKGNRYGEVLGSAWMAMFRTSEDNTLKPVSGPCWAGRDYFVNPIAGYEWPQSLVMHPLAIHGRAPNGSHFRRYFRACASLAAESRLARYMLLAAWLDVQSAWALDGPLITQTNSEGEQVTNTLLSGFQHVLAEAPIPYTATGLRGSRDFAHALACLNEAWDYLSEPTRTDYATAFIDWYLKVSDIHGLVNRDRSGGAKVVADASGISGDPTSMFHQALIYVGVYRLVRDRSAGIVGPEIRGAVQRLDACARFMTPGPWPYIVSSISAKQSPEATWMMVPFAGSAPDGGDYALAVTGVDSKWGSPREMDLRAREIGPNGDQLYDYVPRTYWEGKI